MNVDVSNIVKDLHKLVADLCRELRKAEYRRDVAEAHAQLMTEYYLAACERIKNLEDPMQKGARAK